MTGMSETMDSRVAGIMLKTVTCPECRERVPVDVTPPVNGIEHVAAVAVAKISRAHAPGGTLPHGAVSVSMADAGLAAEYREQAAALLAELYAAPVYMGSPAEIRERLRRENPDGAEAIIRDLGIAEA